MINNFHKTRKSFQVFNIEMIDAAFQIEIGLAKKFFLDFPYDLTGKTSTNFLTNAIIELRNKDNLRKNKSRGVYKFSEET